MRVPHSTSPWRIHLILNILNVRDLFSNVCVTGANSATNITKSEACKGGYTIQKELKQLICVMCVKMPCLVPISVWYFFFDNVSY